MKPYFAFSDESGNYEQIRESSFLRSNPFYVRSTIIISMEDYISLQTGIEAIKRSFGLSPEIEVKWSHYGSTLKKNYQKISHALTPEQLGDYYKQCLGLFCSLNDAVVYFTFTNNEIVGKIDKIALMKMHLQNAYQRVQAVMSEKNGYAIFIMDDLHSKNKALKNAAYQMTLKGDYVQYTNIKKGLYVDFSDQCPGLQMADIYAGIFTAVLKYESSEKKDQHKFEMGYNLFFEYGYKKIRHIITSFPYSSVYRYGIKDIPARKENELAKKVSHQVEKAIDDEWMQSFRRSYEKD